MAKVKALVLLSGGLDSMLSAAILKSQGVEVTGLSFASIFFGTGKARKAAAQIGVPLREMDFSTIHLDVVKNPKYGYGKNMNPCIDCHSLMLRVAKKIMEDEGFDFVATGEVLGQRPMSQNKQALQTVAEYSGIGDRLVRPLSAKLLEETWPEKNGLLVRGKLLDISGRSRERQMELAPKYGLLEYPSPAGGCLLTDPEFSDKLEEMFEYWPECKAEDIEILKYGRISWLNLVGVEQSKVLLAIGRNKEDNAELESLAIAGDIIITLKDYAGPTTLLRGLKQAEIPAETQIFIPLELKKSLLNLGDPKPAEEILQDAMLLTGYHTPKARGQEVAINIKLIKN